MDTEVKKQFILMAAKQINEDCSGRCFVLKNENCMDTCFNEYLKVFNSTVKTLRECGYERYSRFVELAYGNGNDEWTRITMFNDLAPNAMGRPNYYFEENPFDQDKSRFGIRESNSAARSAILSGFKILDAQNRRSFLASTQGFQFKGSAVLKKDLFALASRGLELKSPKVKP